MRHDAGFQGEAALTIRHCIDVQIRARQKHVQQIIRGAQRASEHQRRLADGSVVLSLLRAKIDVDTAVSQQLLQ